MKVPSDILEAARVAERKWDIPTSVQLAQWALESGWGAHSPGFNPFGMKPRKGMNDPQQIITTTEWHPRTGYYQTKQAFRVFPSIAAAFDAHAELLATAPIYAPAMAKLPDVAAFIPAMAAHYATDPLYARKLSALISQQGWAGLDQPSAVQSTITS